MHNYDEVIGLLDRMERQLVDLQASLAKAQELVKELTGPTIWTQEEEDKYRMRHQS